LDKIKPVVMLAEGKRPEDHLQAFDLTYSWNLYDVLADVVYGGKTVKVLDDIIAREKLQYPRNSLRMRFDTNHDKTVKDGTPVRRYSSKGSRATAALIFTYPGVPLIYDGEEVGNSKKLDHYDKVDIDWSKGTEYRKLFTTLAQIRKQHPALSRGDYQRIWCSDSTRVFAFQRTTDGEQVTVAINFSGERKEVRIEGKGDLEDLLSGRRCVSDGRNVRVSLAPYGTVILVPRKKGSER
jgi:glycosidase